MINYVQQLIPILLGHPILTVLVILAVGWEILSSFSLIGYIGLVCLLIAALL